MSKIKIIAFIILGFIVYKIFVAVKNFEIGVNKQVAEIEKMGFEREDEVIGLMMYLGDEEDLLLFEHFLVHLKYDDCIISRDQQHLKL